MNNNPAKKKNTLVRNLIIAGVGVLLVAVGLILYFSLVKPAEKVVEKPIYEKFIDTGEIHKEDYTECCALYSFKHNRIELYMYDFVNYLEMKDYSKTWALTKEELEK